MYVNYTGDMTVVFFYSAGFSYVRKVTHFFFAGPLQTMFHFSCNGILSLGCIRTDTRIMAPFKMTCILVC